jgi:alkaline phosphatase D
VPSPIALNAASTAGPDQSVPVCVHFSVFNNEQLAGSPVAQGEAFTSYDVDFTVKVEATGLEPDTVYWYQFEDCAAVQGGDKAKSPVGKTRTFADENSACGFVSMSG